MTVLFTPICTHPGPHSYLFAPLFTLNQDEVDEALASVPRLLLAPLTTLETRVEVLNTVIASQCILCVCIII